MTQVTINANTYSDDGSASKDMRNGGHKLWLLPMVADVAATGVAAAASAAAAAASAAAASSSAANLLGTSSTTLTIATGAQSLTASTGRQWAAGQYLAIIDAGSPANAMFGQIGSYNSGSGALTVTVDAVLGSGTMSSWVVCVSGKTGAQGNTGLTGPSGSALTRVAQSTNVTVGAADNAKLWDCSGTFTLTFAAPGTLGSTWTTYVRNVGSGVVTLSHTSGNIDGLASYPMLPGEMRLVHCDGSTLRTAVLNPFAVAGSATFGMPPGYKRLGFDMIGGGGGGACGGRGTSYSYGGPGGGGGAHARGSIDAPAAGTAITVSVGSGGAGAAGRSTDGDRVAGTSGSATMITWSGIDRARAAGGYGGGAYATAYGGRGGDAGLWVSDGSPANSAGHSMGGIGGDARSSSAGWAAEWGGGGGGASAVGGAGYSGGGSVYGGAGGGSGGAAPGGVDYAGGAGGKSPSYVVGGGGAGGASGGGAGGTATASGGGGGGSAHLVAAGSGGNGTGAGSAGGGGGGQYGAFNSGAGGAGIDGAALVWGEA